MSKQKQTQKAVDEKDVKKEKIVIEFTGPYQRYANGDIAGFDAEVAEKILSLKPAVAKAYQVNSTDSSEQTQ